MIRAMWTAATGMTAQQLNVDTIAHNLANVNTNAFKRSRAEFSDLLYQIQRLPGTNASNIGVFPTGVQIGAGVRPVTVAKEWLQGNMRQTNNELDLAIDGPGFFQVSRPDGTIMYTRNGSFKRDNVGNLVTGDGDQLTPVITVPSGALKIDIGQDGTVSVLLPGVTQASQVGQIQLVRFDNPSGLVSMGNNLFLDSFASGPALQGTGGFTTGFGTLQQGFLESSNVNLAEEMVNMIIAQRSYEINSKTIQASDEMMQIANNLRR
ncbi:MAG: Flagellar basal-body rod protein FlgG [Nitrospira sp.]|jgi:flagellar basal-body rod protein FlgG|nr:MAG: Flagellar basal-body rod protein FlgG [Nitrospira sp.]WHZ21658.1 MAG: Flagellar basal-body rod protein FlgG [Nitrospira sp.]